MRDKFSELIEQGVATNNYIPTNLDLPQLDPICRMYNNIFSIPSDTHMSQLPDSTYIITGHMINTKSWDCFLTSTCWGGINFHTNNEFWCLSDFLHKYGLTGSQAVVNGDVVYKVYPEPIPQTSSAPNNITGSYTTSESQIPHPIKELVTNGDTNKFYECVKDNINDTVKSLNESLYIKGNNWSVKEGQIIGLIGNMVVSLSK